MLNQVITIYTQQMQAPTVAYAVQNDTGRTLTFVPADFVIPAGATAQLWVRLPSGALTFSAGTVAGQEVTAPLTQYNLAEEGVCGAQLQISADGEYIKAFSFVLKVQKEVNGEELTPEEATLLEQVIAELQEQLSDELAAIQADIDTRVPVTRKVNGHALSQDIDLTPADLGAVPDTLEINGHALDEDINLTPADLGAVPDTRTINGLQLNQNRTIEASNVPFTPTSDIESTNVQGAITEAVGLMSEAHEDLLYTNAGTSSPVGDYALAEDVSGYQYLDIYGYFTGLTEVKRIPVVESTGYQLRFMNLADSESSLFLGFSELGVSFAGTTMTVTHNKYESWSGHEDADASISASGKPYIVKVMGVKYDVIGGSGSGGTSDYNDLSNKPQINSVTLSGNVSLDSLGAIPAPSSPATGAFLVWNGAAWVAQTLSTWQGGSY